LLGTKMTYVNINWYEFAVTHNDTFRYLVKVISKHMELSMPSSIRLLIRQDSIDSYNPWVEPHRLSILTKHGKKQSMITLSLDNTRIGSIEKFVSDISIDCCNTVSIDATELIGIIKDMARTER
jgi:hypothetical protein